MIWIYIFVTAFSKRLWHTNIRVRLRLVIPSKNASRMDHPRNTWPGREAVQQASLLVPDQSCPCPSCWKRCRHLRSHWRREDALILDCSSDTSDMYVFFIVTHAQFDILVCVEGCARSASSKSSTCSTCSSSVIRWWKISTRVIIVLELEKKNPVAY